MILSFKNHFPWGDLTNFPQKISDGIKIHSIREDPHGRWKAGRLIHMATGVRTKNYNCFWQQGCVSVQKIEIKHYSPHEPFNISKRVFIDGRLLYNDERNGAAFTRILNLAKNDGFDSAEDFFKWFDSDFNGQIIHWTDFKY